MGDAIGLTWGNADLISASLEQVDMVLGKEERGNRYNETGDCGG